MKPTILVPHDFEASAAAALRWAADLQRTTGGPPIHILHAVNPVPAGATELIPLAPTPDEVEQLTATLRAAARAENAEIRPHVIVRAASAGNVILDAAEKFGIDLIVMGTHGRTGVRRVLLGSVAEYAVRHSTCPVVTVRAPT